MSGKVLSGWLRSKTISALPLVLLLAACAAPQNGSIATQPAIAVETVQVNSAELDALRALVTLQNRLDRVAAPLLINNAPLCKGNARNLLGFTAKNKYSYSAALTNASQQAFGLDERLQVIRVLAGSGAASVGVRRGDILLAVDDKPIPQGPNAEKPAAELLAPLVQSRSSVKLTVLRGGASVSLNVPLTMACAFSIEIGNTDNVNAYDDGHRIVVTRGMMNFAQSDEELAYVVAREMAHNALGHTARQRMTATLGDIIDNLIRMHPDMSTMTGTGGVKAYPQELDAAADTLALTMAVNAGYSIDQSPRFWQRLAMQYPATVLTGYTAIHPGTTYRLTAIGKAIADIKNRQAGRR